MRALRPGHQRFAGYHGPKGHTRGDALCSADNVWFNVVMFDSPPFTRAPHPRLNLVYDQQHIVAITQLSQCGEESWRRHYVAALTLDGFHQYARHVSGWQKVAKNFFL